MSPFSPGVSRWRILRDPPAPGAWNMAVDEALATLRRGDQGILRIYRWARPTLSFGRNQAVLGRYDPDVFGPLGAEAVRRPTGGREVLHDRELTYAVILPLAGPATLRAVYRAVNRALLEALRSLGVEGRMASRRGRTPSPDAGACFREPAEGEVEVEGRKMVGSAQARVGRNLLQHGSLLLHPASIRLASLTLPSVSDAIPEQTGVTLGEALGGPLSFSRVSAAVEAALAGEMGGRWDRSELASGERDAAERLRERYASRDWTWRR